MNVLIIEDEHLAASKLERQLTRIDESIDVVGKADSVQSAVKWLRNNTAELIFCDIHLGDGNSFTIFKEVEVKTPIIFTTAYDQYAVQAFKLNSIDYLLKPIAKDDLEQALDKFNETRTINQSLDFSALLDAVNQSSSEKEYQKRFMVYVGEHIRTVDIADVAYFYAEGKYVFLVTKEGKEHNIEFTLDRLTLLLNPSNFYRVNRQFIIGLESIADMYTWSKSRVKLTLNPKAKEDVVVSRERSSDFKKWLNS